MIVLEYKVKGKIEQYKAIDQAIRTTQFVRNKAIRYWMDNSRELKIDKFALNRYSTTLRKEFSFVDHLNSMAVQSAAERGWSAISRFYDNCKKKISGKKGYPRFQKDGRSVEYKTSGWALHPTKRQITFTDKNRIGKLKLLGKWDIHTNNVKDIKRVRLIRRADGYYAQFCLNITVTDVQPETGKEIGLDVGIESFYTDSNGYQEPNPKFLRKAEQSIKQSQRQIYKKVKGSSGRRKARKVYSKKHLKVSRQRIEHAKRIARNVCTSNDVVAYEDLSVRNLVKNHCLAKSISDASWYLFRQWIEYFAAKFDKLAIPVAPHYTSQKCSNCGVIVKKSLSTRTHICNCGCELHRDTNAAINILNLAKQARDGQSRSNANGLETSTLLGVTLVEQVSRSKLESPSMRERGVST
ncbi:RNA-guided endonuclease TnpB family protein [Planktothrix sp. FACHB-1365]|uniref:RNA-guided endonuclease InsQ/TnpB family protein n=1 Tax=Planktothrix sp. FACHB-1365 TaxID=2692855 RepID=UPI00168611E7|nr:RNA-guided endonuclease TnpB family protein [Planktothrix sp. FACHB-1365]MBD2481509.1 transposase [Planktothrix sp. FACHB-1365]